MSEKFGYITQVIGPVVDVTFEGEGNTIPPIYAALKIERQNEKDLLVEGTFEEFEKLFEGKIIRKIK